MYCPACRAEYREGFVSCAECGIELVDGVPLEEEEVERDVETRDLIEVFRSGDPTLLPVLQSLLEACGIPFVVRNERFHNLFGAGLGTRFSALVDVQILVDRERAEEARSLLSQVDTSQRSEENNEVSDGPPFVSISVAKVVVLSIATLGLYEVYWFYRHWRRVDDWTANPFVPLGKAFLWPLYGGRLFQAIGDALDEYEVPRRFDPFRTSLLYYLLVGSPLVLPSPYAFLFLTSGVVLGWLQSAINELHSKSREDSRPRILPTRSEGVFVVVVWIGLALLFLTPTVAVPGGALDAATREWLAEEGYLEPGEEILYFYSRGADQASFYTSQKVVSLYLPYYQEVIRYPEIADIRFWFDPSIQETVVVVFTHEEKEVGLLAGTGEPAQGFVEGLQREWRLGPLRSR